MPSKVGSNADAQDIELFLHKRHGTDEDLFRVGKISYGERGKLKIVSVEKRLEAPLLDIIEAVNAEEELRIKTPPPPGSPQFSICTKTVDRDDPDLLAVMKDYLEQAYGLVVVKEIEDELEESADPVFADDPPAR